MNKKELAHQLAARTGLTQVRALEVVNALFDAEGGLIAETLASKEKVVIPGFGTFRAGVRAARNGKHPGTGEPIQIAARPMVSFKLGRNLELRLAQQEWFRRA